jgi:hypothetical protein
MSEFQLYQKRDFSALMNDTMSFFKQFWKNYFRNYVVINGSLILLMCVLYFLVFKDLYKDMYTPKVDGSWFTNMNHPLLFAGGMILFFVVTIVLSVFTTAFPMIYLKLLKTKGEEVITSSEIFDGIKSYAQRLIYFGIISFFIMIPLGIIVFAIGAALSILIIGIPLLFLALPTYMIWITQAMYVYLEEEESYFTALGKGWKITFEKYWHVVGSTIVLSAFVMIVSSIFSMVPVFMMLSKIITSGGHVEPTVMTPTMLAFSVIGMIFSYFAYNILYVQQGLVYYSSRENDVNYQAFSEIENIGNNEA